MNRPEILAPVADRDMLLAAIHNGADAVYCGMPYYNARARTEDFTPEELGEMISLAHLYGVKFYLAFNVLIFEEELPPVLDLLRKVLPLGPDALIVQDIGLAVLLRRHFPGVRLHASTQMTVAHHEAINLLADLHPERFVLARELSVKEIKEIAAHTESELEVFVHGALCVAYSGQCLTSEHIGGRSANRGRCAQACRLEYDMMVDGETKNLGDRRYLVSPRDLAAGEFLPELEKAGIRSWKIEGRYKSAEYVAATVRHYRGLQKGGNPPAAAALTFARDSSTGWLAGVNHRELVNATVNSHTGLFAGKAEEYRNGTLKLKTHLALKNGDGIAVITGWQKQGGFISRVEKIGALTSLQVSLKGEIPPGTPVYLSSSAGVNKDLSASFTDKTRLKKIPITTEVELNPGDRLKATASDGRNRVTMTSENTAENATNRALSEESLREEFNKGGDFPFDPSVTVKMAGGLFLPLGDVKKTRQNLYAQLAQLRQQPPPLREIMAPLLREPEKKPAVGETESWQLLIREPGQLDAALESTAAAIILDFEHGGKYQAAVEKIRAAGKKAVIATTRILKSKETRDPEKIRKAQPDAVLARNLAAVEIFRREGMEILGDFSLNVTNHESADYFLGKGITLLTPSYDLNSTQLLNLCGKTRSEHLCVTILQNMPEFHMEHCVFAAFLSNGKDYRDCGTPCERHRVELRDRAGVMHPVKSDMECRNTMFHGTAQSAIGLLPDLREAGVRKFRVEVLFEEGEDLKKILSTCDDLFSGNITPEEANRRLKAETRYGVSEGMLKREAEPAPRKK